MLKIFTPLMLDVYGPNIAKAKKKKTVEKENIKYLGHSEQHVQEFLVSSLVNCCHVTKT